ncbi:DUF853 family protein [Nanohaloarchaea archaeon]|nr:DUF853 family protein [Candidatus Nanohaloarchaea archaeon]
MKRLTLLMAILIALSGSAASLSVEDDIPSLNVVFENKEQIYSISMENTRDTPSQYAISTTGSLSEILETSDDSVSLGPGEESSLRIRINTSNAEKELYTGTVTVSGEEEQQQVPLGFRVVSKTSSPLSLNVQTTSDTTRPGSNVSVFTVVSASPRDSKEMSIFYEIRRSSDGEEVHQYNKSVEIDFKVNSFTQDLPLKQVGVGEYYVQTNLRADNRTVRATDTFTVNNPFWTPLRVKIALLLVSGGIVLGGGFYTWRWYKQRKSEEARYVFPVDYDRLPAKSEDNYWVGKIAETEKEAYIDPSDLTTHAIVAGSTGSGKSVTADVIAEEALENDVPVVVFDPTAQWTGFVKELKDDDLKQHYSRFGMDPETDPHPYPGIIKEISSGDPDIDFKQLKQPGEITVFTLNDITTEEFDDAVRKIIDQIFDIEWEESPTLEMLIIFDEVHRLLEEYGGKGGYQALEKGAREFRKWGIGLMMASQVTADFKQAISGNIMTELQMQTKSMEDIDRVETKYGEQFAKRISSEDVGTGMIQNSNYNDGDPWFVDFRPTYHNPHKIPDTEMQKYHKLSKRVDRVREAIQEKEDQGEDMQDKKLELNLADNKLKEGRFKMTKMYVDTLEDEIDVGET